MKRVLIICSLLAVIACSFSSCATMKRDCQGRKHTRLANGIYL